MNLLIQLLNWAQDLFSNVAEAITLASITPRRVWVVIFLSVLNPILKNLLEKMYIDGISLVL